MSLDRKDTFRDAIVFPYKKTSISTSGSTPIVHIPGSKSHTIRALLLAGVAKGTSIIHNPLMSGDTRSCIEFLVRLGVQVLPSTEKNYIVVTSRGIETFTDPKFDVPITWDNPIDVGNSGTTLYFATALAALSPHPLYFTGDDSLQTRSALSLLNALRQLGATIDEHGKDADVPEPDVQKHGCVPYSVRGMIDGNTESIDIECYTSQFLSALILLLSLVEGKRKINPILEGEFSYVEMTIMWLRKHNLEISYDKAFKHIEIVGGIEIQAFEEYIPGDFSSGAFFLSASAIIGCPLILEGLQRDPTQADMMILDILETMGCSYSWEYTSDTPLRLSIRREGKLVGGEFDLSNTPDLLPILAIVASYASTPTRLYNVEHARKKETDRIALMRDELSTLGVIVEEHEDGLSFESRADGLLGGEVSSHHDHRIAMAFAVGALSANKAIMIRNAYVASITFPTFFDIFKELGVEVDQRH